MASNGDFLLAARPDAVELTLLGDRMTILSLSPRLARSLARNLNLYAEKAEIIAMYRDAAVGPREGRIAADGSDHA